MRYKLYLELASRIRDAGILELLRFPSIPVSSGDWVGTGWCKGKTLRATSQDREEVLSKLLSEGTNYLDLKWRLHESTAEPKGLRPVGLWQEFFPSPVNSLWSRVPAETLKSRPSDRVRRNMLMIESILTKPNGAVYPSTLQSFLELEYPGADIGEERLQEASIRWMISALPEGLASAELFGYGCVHGTCRRMQMVMSLGIPELAELDRKFENLYPILIGPRETCAAFASVLGPDASLIPLPEPASSAILNVNPKRIKTLASNPTVRKWLLGKTHAEAEKTVWVVPPRTTPNRPQ